MIQIIIRGKDESAAAAQSAAGHLKQVGDAAESQGSRIRGFFSGLKTVMAGALVGVGAGIGIAAKSGLDFNNAIEQASAKINAFTKDGAKTAEILDMVRDRASKTPFEFNEMANAASALMPTVKASGKSLEELLEISEILAASNPAEGLEGAAFALKEVASGDFTSIIERFNLPRARLKELREQGVPDIEAVKIAMKELGLDTDLVANMAGTLEGRWSTFKDTITSTLGVITQPIFNALSSGLGNVNDLLVSATPKIQAFAETLAGQIGGAISGVVGWIGQLVDKVTMIASAFQTSTDPVRTFFDILGIYVPIVQPYVGLLTSLTEKALLIGSAFMSSTDPARTLFDILGIYAPQLQPLIPLVQALAAQFQAAIPGALAAGQEAFTQLGSVVQERMAAIQAVVSSVLPIITAFWAENGASIMATVQTAFTTIVNIITVASSVVNALLLALAGYINAHATEINAVLTGVWNIISGVITTVMSAIEIVIRTALALITGDWNSQLGAIKAAGETMFQGIASFILGIMQLIAAGWGTSLGEIVATWESNLGKLAALATTALNAAQTAITSQVTAFTTAAASIGGAIIAGIVSGITGGVGALKSAVESAANAALSAAKKALGIESPSRLFAVAVGLPIAQGMAEGIQRGAPLVQSAGGSLASAAAAGAMAAQRVDVSSRSEVSLSMSGGLERLIDARIDGKMGITSRASDTRRRFG